MNHNPYAALQIAAFRRYLAGHVIAVLGQGMLAVAVGWELYERTGSAFSLGIVGLAQVIPLILFVLPAGQLADRHDRRLILMLAEGAIVVASLGIAWASSRQAPVWVYYALLIVYGAGRTFALPAKQAIMPNLVPLSSLTNAVAWNSGGWQAADMIGPALGGGLIAWTGGATTVYLACAAAAGAFIVLVSGVRATQSTPLAIKTTWSELLQGIRFVRRSPILLAAMSLDLFAVLLGGVIALLPIYAKDILQVGPAGLGWLRAAQSMGAVGMSVILAHRKPFARAGRALLGSVLAFGVAIIVFGLSRSFPLSLAALVLAGAFDAVSVVIRLALAQIQTPDVLRGRVSAVNSLFIGMSNELGEAESGFLAGLVGPVGAVAAGGVAVIGVVGAVAITWPQLGAMGQLTAADPGGSGGPRPAGSVIEPAPAGREVGE
jgi:MFS family permease